MKNILLYINKNFNENQSFVPFSKEVTKIYNLNEFLTTPAKIKLAVYRHHNLACLLDMIEDIDKLSNVCDQVFILGSEINDRILLTYKFLDRKNCHFFIGGVLKNNFKNAKSTHNIFWLSRQKDLYKISDIDKRLKEKFEKKWKFECLLGTKKPHRELIYYNLKNNPEILLSNFLNGCTNQNSVMGNQNSIFWESDIKKDKESKRHVEFMGRKMLLSQTMPFGVYNESYYSIVCETHYSNDFSFFTEKTAKPILAKRLFVPVSGQYFLRNLRKLGFRTFDGIIDETFDEIEDMAERYSAIINEINKLCKQDPREVLEKCQEIVDYNRKVLLSLPHFNTFFVHHINDYIKKINN